MAFTVVSGLLMLAVMITIFVFSNQKGEESSQTSNAVGGYILEIVEEVFHKEVPPGVSPDTVPLIFDFTIRNLAHIFLFACLGGSSFLFCLSGLALSEAYGRGLKEQHRRFRAPIAAVAALGFSFLYACLDEFHQSFVGGRSATLRDIGIDAIGFCLAIGLVFAITALAEFLLRRKKS